jgi:hypothetical protein
VTEQIRTKVARVLNSREIVIAAGAESGVLVGMYFDVIDPKGENVTDPDTGEILGSIHKPKVRVQVTSVQPRISVASTFKVSRVNVGGAATHLDFGVFSRALLPPKYVTKYETLKTDEKSWEDIEEEQSYVKVGDPVVEVTELASIQDEDVDKVAHSSEGG